MALTPEQQALDFNPELQDVSRQRKLADLLMAQGFNQPQGQMISGHYVAPSWTQNLAPIANILAGQAVGERADTKQAQMAELLRVKGDAAAQDVMQTYQQNPQAALAKATQYQQFPQVKALLPQLSKVAMPEATTLEREFVRAQNDLIKPFKGSFNEFKNQMSEAQKQDLAIQRARLGLAQQEQAFNLGLPMGSGGGAPQGQAPMQTIAPGSPIFATGQQTPMQIGATEPMPRFRSKAEQDIWLAGQKKRAEQQAEATAALPAAKASVESGLQAINEMIGDTTVDKNGKVIYGETKPHPGFYGAVGISGPMTGFGASGYIPGTDVTDFKTRFDQVKGQAFLGAINTLRGTGQITEIEGDKATKAINRMSLAQSEAEFVKAANDFKEALNKGYVAAQQKAGVSPMNYSSTPSVGGTTPKYRYNPATGTLE